MNQINLKKSVMIREKLLETISNDNPKTLAEIKAEVEEEINTSE